MTVVGTSELFEYMCDYILSYRKEYEHFTTPSPEGLGYPKLEISPFAYAKNFYTYIARDSIITVVYSEEPSTVILEGRWFVSNEVREGYIGEPLESKKGSPDEELEIQVEKYDLTGILLLDRLTLGNFLGHFSVEFFPTPDLDFWYPLVFRHINFRSYGNFYEKMIDYIEIFPHASPSVWDKRNIPVRVQFDVKRDLKAWSERIPDHPGTIRKGGYGGKSLNLYDRLSKWEKAIDEFEHLLRNQPNAEEEVFHDFLFKNPELLDLYGRVESKPRFHYPTEESPTGKIFVEPDFLIAYPHNTYRLVELERPSKQMATEKGPPRSGVVQAVWQLAEWQTFIQDYYYLIKEKYSGINSKCSYMIIISRSIERVHGGKISKDYYSGLLKAQFGPEKQILTYDDLLSLAKSAYLRISSLR